MSNRSDVTKEPMEFLEAMMQGQDLRYNSDLMSLVGEIESDNFGDPPDDEQWERLVKLVEEQYKFKPVSQSASLTAARTLAEYTHAKRKSIELTDGSELVDVPDLTDTELELFEAWYDEQF